MVATCRRLSVTAIATILAASSCLSVTSTVLAQSQVAATSAEADAKLKVLTDTIENELTTSQSMPPDVTATFASAIELLPNASAAGRRVLIEMPKRLQADALRRQNDESTVQTVNLEVFADVAAKKLAAYAKTANAYTPALTTSQLAVSTIQPQAPPKTTLSLSQPEPHEVSQQIQGLQQQAQALQAQVTQQTQELETLRAKEDKLRQSLNSMRREKHANLRSPHGLPCGDHPGTAVVATQAATWVTGRLGHGCIFYQF
jgi:Asp-tRNA(Asn)/Glu-tRNA(Gln) amidotransferase A subunit family amidase